ncbi:peptide MFS transporter [Actinoalloteichus hymeniacidonis]|uniref:Amino acid/peptide transporter (Peptide:H symporter) n=1 Tax=Actinoalloteichus hymeniacidonis TaxID=340345 RepID=A0AAC9HP93_9PSEU|nr:oligopeptide:H+ symporter [Actinoalloteichus hymeniacidonis]AOS62898.1 amino acid/peptide transporter (peptide:H symporter) [Actinoalloteichus hymeniacidonis]MBB5909069.1 POT family proton-dependent oligopeptide transporter [Actinoalloteichus hymeniacidonis]
MNSATPHPSAEPVRLRAMPRWYATLFSTDALERFGFFGMQAVLVLYASAPRTEGGLGLPIGQAAPLFGAWIGLMFMLSHFGGWCGDRVLGQRRALTSAAFLGMVGYLLMALPVGIQTVLGLIVLAVAGGLFKPNHQAMINLMFSDARQREAGISLMYVGVQISALLAPLITGYLGERVHWRLGFLVAALMMLLCGLRLANSGSRFGVVGAAPARPLDIRERAVARRRATIGLGVVLAATLVLWWFGALHLLVVVALIGIATVIAPFLGFAALHRDPGLGSGDRRRLRAFLVVFLGAALFWMMNAHASSLLNLFARDHTDRMVLGWEVPASWLQSATPLFILMLAPVIAAALPRIGRRNNVAVKFAIGLVLMGGSFLLMSVATSLASMGALVSPGWLLVVYLAHAGGEIVIASVSIAAAAEVLPTQFTSRLLGLLWLFAGLGGGLGSGVVQLAQLIPEPLYYLLLGSITTGVGLCFVLGRRRLTRSLSRGRGEGSAGSTVPNRPVGPPPTPIGSG